jgi:hypothetical protein
MRRGCWASSLGDCAGRISDEHPISQSLLGEGFVQVAGGPWPDGSLIPVRRLAAPTLCERHNGALSELDAEVGRLGEAIRAAFRTQGPAELSVDGALLERWCLKALVGIVAGGWHKPHGERIALQEVPPELVAIAFGRRPFPADFGLHVVNYAANLDDAVDAVSWRVLVGNPAGTAIVGALFGMPPLALGLALGPGEFGALVRQLDLPGFPSWREVTTSLRPPIAIARSKGGAEIRIAFRWPPSN